MEDNIIKYYDYRFFNDFYRMVDIYDSMFTNSWYR